MLQGSECLVTCIGDIAAYLVSKLILEVCTIYVLTIAIGAHVMLTVIVDVANGLVNGACGKIEHIICNSTTNEVITILVCFDNHSVGINAIQHSSYVYINKFTHKQ